MFTIYQFLHLQSIQINVKTNQKKMNLYKIIIIQAFLLFLLIKIYNRLFMRSNIYRGFLLHIRLITELKKHFFYFYASTDHLPLRIIVTVYHSQ